MATTVFAEVVESPVLVPIVGDVQAVQEEKKEVVECSCIKIARSVGVKIPLGTNAEDLKPNTTPHLGSLILLKYGDIWHVAVILGYTDSGFKVVEGNFHRGPCVPTERVLAFNDVHIVGFWSLKGGIM